MQHGGRSEVPPTGSVVLCKHCGAVGRVLGPYTSGTGKPIACQVEWLSSGEVGRPDNCFQVAHQAGRESQPLYAWLVRLAPEEAVPYLL